MPYTLFLNTLCFFFVFQLPVWGMELEIFPKVAKQGQTIEVFTFPDDACAKYTQVKFLGKTYRGFLSMPDLDKGKPRSYRSLIALPVNLKPGIYEITSEKNSEKIQVVYAAFGVQRLRLPKSKDNFQSSPGETEAVDAAKETVSNEKLWSGKFSIPCKARVSANFGLRRIVNGKLLSDYFHSGIDYAGGYGAPVYAAQAGNVILSCKGWKLHGNVICIDHGQGVVSFYIHLRDIYVAKGQFVQAGDKIATVGASGRANGPHLHFSIYVNNQAANPGDWFAKAF